jgi:protein ImuA
VIASAFPLRDVVERRFSRTVSVSPEIDANLSSKGLPLSCLHEVKGSSLASAIGFVSLLAGRIATPAGQVIYVGPGRSFHPLGLLPYGIKSELLIHVSVRRTEDLAWTVLEALRCPRVTVVLAVMKTADLTLCRRFQLAAESSGATGFLVGDTLSATVASVITRWRIASTKAPVNSSFAEPCWEIELSYCRSGRPGKWTTVWRNGRLETFDPIVLPGRKTIQRVEVANEDSLAV